MGVRAPALAVFLILVSLTGCGRSQVGTSFEAAARKQTALDNMTLELFKRSPIVDSGDGSINSTSDLDLISRTSLTFPNVINTKAAIQSSDFTVLVSQANKTAPNFFDYAGEFISSTDSAFQVFMTYHHVTKAKTYATGLFSDINFAASGNVILPMKVYAKDVGDVLGTSYDPGSKVIYLMNAPTSVRPKYSVADEADAVYHEFGHAVQDALNKTVIDTPIAGAADPYPANRDLDAILEGLADLYAAGIARDDAILPYLSANLPALLSKKSRTGYTSYKRSLSNSLSFPNGYVRAAHLDGRVLAAAMNDLRRFLAGYIVRVPAGCSGTGCTDLKISSGSAVANSVAWDRTVNLAYRTYEAMTSKTTMFGFGVLLADRCANSSYVSDWCSVSEVSSALTTILDSRGIKPTALATNNTALTFTANGVAGVLDATTPATGTNIVFNASVGAMDFPNDKGFANRDGEADLCEVFLIYPSFSLDSAADPLYDVAVKLESISAFTNLKNPSDQSVVETTTPVTGASRKLMGWIKPGESSGQLLDFVYNTSSRWYDAQFGSYLSQKLSASYYPSDLGWLARTPATQGATASAQFRVTGRRYNATTIDAYFTALVTQKITNVTTAKSEGDFCSN